MPTAPTYYAPFATRQNLDFNFGTTFALRATTQTDAVDPVYVVGATKQGTFKFQLIPDGTGNPLTVTLNIPDLPIWVSVVDIDGNYSVGNIFVALALQINGDVLQGLASGYVGVVHPVSWPITANNASMPNSGRLTFKASADPAAGAELTLTVPAGQQWHIESVSFTLVTDANAANRVVSLIFTPSLGAPMECISANIQTATLTRNYRCFATTPGGATTIGTSLVIPIPQNLILQASSTITTVTNALQATDNYGAMNVSYLRYFVN